MKKTVLALVMVVVLAMALSVTAFAAEGVTEAEQELLNKFASGSAFLTTPDIYVSQAEKYLAEEDLTDEQIAGLSDAIDEVVAMLNAGGYNSIEEVKASAEYETIVAKIQAAAATVGYTVEPGDPRTTGAIITKQTGSSVLTTVAIVALLSVALAGAFVVAGKKNLFAAQA